VCSGSSASCPADTIQDEDGDGVCDSQDKCPNAADPDQADGDGDGIGDACDPCTNVDHIVATKVRLKLTKLDTAPGDEGLSFKGRLDGVPTTPTIDPTTKGVRLILETSPGGAFLDVTLPGGTGWKANKKKTSFRFKSASGVGGIRSISLKTSPKHSGRVQFKVTGKSVGIANPTVLPVKGTLVIDSPLAMTGQCGETGFSSTSCKRNKKGSTLTCR
jgi:hypothetical protein